MSQEIIEAVREIERDKGIEEGALVAALEDALLAAYKKTPDAVPFARVEIDRDRGTFQIHQFVGDAHAQLVVDALGMVDVDDEAIRIRELDGQEVDPRKVVLDPGRDLALQLLFPLVCRGHPRAFFLLVIKNGPAGPFRRTGENGRPSVASE